MTASISAAYGLRALPEPTGRGRHHRASVAAASPPEPGANAWHLVQAAFVLFPVGTPYHGTRKYDAVGEVHDVLQRSSASGQRKRQAARALHPPIETGGCLAHVL